MSLAFTHASYRQNFDRWQGLFFVRIFISIFFGRIIFKLLLTNEPYSFSFLQIEEACFLLLLFIINCINFLFDLEEIHPPSKIRMNCLTYGIDRLSRL